MKRALLYLLIPVLAVACGSNTPKPGLDASIASEADASVESADGSIAGGPDAALPAGLDAGVQSSRAYKGHLADQDINAFVNAYPATVGTRLDDCQTCHKATTLTTTGGKQVSLTACNFCHLVQHPDATLTGQPTTYADTLNPYGAAYKAAGRTRAALTSIDSSDSDGDTFNNGVEIAALKYPGDPASKPGQPNAPQKLLSLAQLKAMTNHSEFLLANSQKQQYDFYATYVGVTLKDLLTAVGVNPADAAVQGVTVIAPDGFTQSVASSAINQQFPNAKFWAGLDTATLGTTCGYVQYPASLPAGLTDGADIPDAQFVMLAWERDGAAMDPSSLDPVTGKIQGEGPYRLVVPQATPGKPDRGSTYSPTACLQGQDYDPGADHNAGSMVRGPIAVRIDPLPAGVEDFDTRNGGWAYVTNSTVIVYGYGITQ
jgi:hypothetical protein